MTMQKKDTTKQNLKSNIEYLEGTPLKPKLFKAIKKIIQDHEELLKDTPYTCLSFQIETDKYTLAFINLFKSNFFIEYYFWLLKDEKVFVYKIKENQ